jgi:hypothetical protein
MNRQLDDTTMDHLRHSHEWVRWLSDADAKILLLYLCHAMEHSRSAENMLHDWRSNALRALDTEDWTAQVDGYLDVRVDARQYLLAQEKI